MGSADSEKKPKKATCAAVETVRTAKHVHWHSLRNVLYAKTMFVTARKASWKLTCRTASVGMGPFDSTPIAIIATSVEMKMLAKANMAE